MVRALNDDSLRIIMYKLSKEDLSVLHRLRTNKCINLHLSIDKTKLIPSTEANTEFKFQTAVSRLEVTNLIGRVANARPNKFYITSDGLALLDLYDKDIRANTLLNTKK
jgi:predicted transcriptional regulator